MSGMSVGRALMALSTISGIQSATGPINAAGPQQMRAATGTSNGTA